MPILRSLRKCATLQVMAGARAASSLRPYPLTPLLFGDSGAGIPWQPALALSVVPGWAGLPLPAAVASSFSQELRFQVPYIWPVTKSLY